MSEDWPNDPIHRLLFKEIERMWRGARPSTFVQRLIHQVFKAPPPKSFLIHKYDGADWDHAVCQGEIVGTWTYDKDGLKRGGPAIPESAENEYFYRTPMIRFHVAPEGDRLVMNSVFGSKAASGNIYRVEQLGEHPMLVPGGPGWRA